MKMVKLRAVKVNFGEETVSEPEDDDDDLAPAQPPVPALPNANPRIAAVQKKSWSSLQRSLVMCHEMDVCSKATLEKLGEGTLRLQTLDEYQTKMERDLLETGMDLDEMNKWTKCCGIPIPNPWAKRRGETGIEGIEREAGLDDQIEQAMSPPKEKKKRDPLALQPGFQREVLPPQPLVVIANDYVEMQMEKNLDMIDTYLETLELAANEIDHKLTKEGKILDETTDYMDKNIIRVTTSRRKALSALHA